MWKPAERIKYEPSSGHWPTVDEAAHALLFTPLKIGRFALNQRSWIPAMVPWRANEEGYVTQDVIDWYSRFAEGKPGAIVVEATGIRDIPSGPLLRIGDDRFIEGLQKLVQAVKTASDGQTKIFIQLIDFLTIRRRPKPDAFFNKYLPLTPELKQKLSPHVNEQNDQAYRDYLLSLPLDEAKPYLPERELENLERGYRERVTDMHLEHIQTLPQILPDLFAKAAQRAKDAGFDGVELHYAHAYTMASFLSKLNNREDGYGGPRENRARLPLEVYKAVRKAVGTDILVGCRFLAEECIDGGNEIEDTAYFGLEFAKAGMDFLSTSRGGKFEDALPPKPGAAIYPYTGPSGYECMPHFISDSKGPFGRNISPTATIRSAIRAAGLETPIVVTGGVHNFTQAEEILQRDEADIVGLARQALADPDWFEKVRLGHGADVRLCEYSNYCEGLDQKHKQVTCQLWDRLDMDKGIQSRTIDGKRRLVAPPWERA